MAAISAAAATRLSISEKQASQAVNLVMGRSIELEVHTELTDGQDKGTKNVAIFVNRKRLEKEARERLRRMPQVEDEDESIIIDILCKRLLDAVKAAHNNADSEDHLDSAEMNRIARDSAFVIIRKQGDELEELLHEEIAAQARDVRAADLPDLMVFPESISLTKSAKNIYGVYPPSKSDLAKVPEVLGIDAIDIMRSRNLSLDDGVLSLAEFDGGHALGTEERQFTEALDRAEFVVWWHRNPDRKPYSARLVRGEHRNYFYPDFIVCLEHFSGDSPMARLIETKESTKDASRKAKHSSKLYGKVLFLTKHNSGFSIVKEDGTLDEQVDFDDLFAMREWLRARKPVNDPGVLV